MTTEYPDLPYVLREVADEMGIGTALQLATDFGGRKIYIPAELEDDHALAKSLGPKKAKELIKIFRGAGYIEVPLGPTNYEAQISAEIDQLLGRGWSEAQIARKLHVHIRTVRRHRARMKDTHPRLFE